MYTKRRIEQIEQLDQVVRQAEQKAAKFKEWGDKQFASYYATIAMATLAMKAELLRREQRQKAALDALQKAKVNRWEMV